jgi:aspartate racemase
MAKHIGIVAGSAEGAALCYRTICIEGANLLGSYDHPEVSIHTVPCGEYIRSGLAGRWEEVGRLLLASGRKLASIGAEVLICPDNTLHQGLDLVIQDSPVPWIHIAQEVAAIAAECNFTRLGIMGTRGLMEGAVYPAKLSARGIACEFPTPEDRHRIDTAIMNELIYGRFDSSTRLYFQEVIRDFEQRGCDAVVLACTELPLLIREGDAALPALDSTRILARAALRESIGDHAERSGR